MNHKYKLVALDIDGTSVNDVGCVTDKTLSALKFIKESGVEIVPCTGRTLNSIPKEIMNLGIKYAITANGANVIDVHNNTIIRSCLIDYITCSKVISFMKKYETIVYVHCNGEAIFDSKNIDRYNEVRCNKRRQMEIVDNLDEYLFKSVKNVEKIGVLNLNNKVIIPREQFDAIRIASTDLYTLEIISKNTSKGDALEWLLDKIGISFDTVISFGDNENDIELFERSGLSIAMGNANQKIKDIASYVTKSNNEDGVYCALKYIVGYSVD